MENNSVLSVTALLLILSLSGLLPSVNGDGKLSYGDKCSVPNAILRIFTNEAISENEKCNLEKGLICTGTCTCPPTRVWYSGPLGLFGLFGGGSCIVGANGPCTKSDQCVANAVCGDNIPLCFCKEGYHAHELQCISDSGFKLTSGSPKAVNLPVAQTLAGLMIANVLLVKFLS